MDTNHSHKMAACERLRSLVHDSISKHMYKASVFFADKLVTLSEEAPKDVYLLAQAYYYNHEYRRALTLLNKPELFKRNIRFRYLAAKCLAQCQEWEECLGIIGAEDNPEILKAKEETLSDTPGCAVNMYSAVCTLRGEVYDALDNRQRAIKWYKIALQTDPFCFEAYQALMSNHMLTNKEERDLVADIDVRQEDRWLLLLYSTMCKKTGHVQYEAHDEVEQSLRALEGEGSHAPAPAPLQPSSRHNDRRAPSAAATASEPMTRSKAARAALTVAPDGAGESQQNMDEDMDRHERREAPRSLSLAGNMCVAAARADFLYCSGRTWRSYEVTSALLRREPRAVECMESHLACMVELGKKNELFKLSHRLVQDYPTRGLAWYAVGCYYLCTGQFDCARRYFGKATQLQPHHAPSWIAYGHSFAVQDESDQALAAYRTAARLFPGLHQPVLGMGREYQHMNNHPLAQQMYLKAYDLCQCDPLICNELGVLFYQKKEYEHAVAWLRRALDQLAPDRMLASWQPTIVNLAHSYRKLGQHDLAIETYSRALGLSPCDSGTFAAIGFTYHLQGKLEAAIEHYHKALGFKHDDAMTQDLLKEALEMHCAHCSQHDDPGLM